MNDVIPNLKNTWRTVDCKMAYVIGGTDHALILRTSFDGGGNAVTRFIVKTNDKETSYEKFDAAADAYAMMLKKGKS